MSSPLAVDVLIVGGSLQGLLILDRLSSQGFSCVLVTASDLGAGQTLHSHGVLNTGFGMSGPEPMDVLRRMVLPDLARRGVETYGEWRMGDQRLAEVNVDRVSLVTALAVGHHERVIRGSIAGLKAAADGRLEWVELAPSGVVFAPGVVIVSAGTGSKALLRRLGAAESQINEIKHRVVQVLCVRGPSTALPAADLVSPPDHIFVASHERDGVRTYLATPMHLLAPHVEDAPEDASAEVDLDFAARGWETLFRVLPHLASTSGLEFAAYAGLRQDFGDLPGVPKCERMETAPNVVAALPGGLLGAWPVAVRASALVNEVSFTRNPQPAPTEAGVGVRVGAANEDSSVEWRSEARRPD